MKHLTYPAKTSRPRIKICGITTREQATAVAAAGADAIGLVFAKSPRQVTVRQAMEIISDLPPLVQTVGVFVDPSPEELSEIMASCQLDLIQMHGNESVELCAKFAPRVIKAHRIRNRDDINTLDRYQQAVRGFLLDTWAPEASGGTGKTFDWSIAAHACRRLTRPVILAGGLTPDNVISAIRAAGPWGIDASSGLEDAPGIKNMKKVEAFIQAVRSYHEQDND